MNPPELRRGEVAPARANSHVPFAVGRVAGDGRGMVLLSPAAPPPFPGPWELKAVFSS